MRIEFMDLAGPVAVAGVSGVGEVLQLNRLEKKTTGNLPDNMFMDNIGVITDSVLAVAAIGNNLLSSPVLTKGSQETMGAGIAIAVRRGTEILGRKLLGLESVVTKTPASGRHLGGGKRHSLAAYEPYDAVDSSRSLNSGRRQFVTVV